MNKEQKGRIILSEPKGPVDALAFHPEGNLLAAAYHGELLVLWDLETGQPISKCALQGKVTSLAFIDSDQVCLAGANLFAYWHILEEYQPLAYLTEYDRMLNVVSANGTAHAHFGKHPGNNAQCCLIVCQGVNTINLFGGWSDSPKSEVQYKSLSLSGDGSKVGISWWTRKLRHKWEPQYAVIDPASQSIALWDPSPVSLHKLSRTGCFLAIECANETLTISNLKNGNDIYLFQSNTKIIMDVDFSSEDRWMAYIYKEPELILIDLEESKITYTHRLIHEPGVVRFSEDGKWLAIGDKAGMIQIYPTSELQGL